MNEKLRIVGKNGKKKKDFFCFSAEVMKGWESLFFFSLSKREMSFDRKVWWGRGSSTMMLGMANGLIVDGCVG